MKEAKIINDPVFGFIKIPCGLLYGIVEHPLFQRLNRINQLGLASVVYPGARHTRFQHSLGAFHLMSEAVLSLQQKGNLHLRYGGRSRRSRHPHARYRARTILTRA